MPEETMTPYQTEVVALLETAVGAGVLALCFIVFLLAIITVRHI